MNVAELHSKSQFSSLFVLLVKVARFPFQLLFLLSIFFILQFLWKAKERREWSISYPLLLNGIATVLTSQYNTFIISQFRGFKSPAIH